MAESTSDKFARGFTFADQRQRFSNAVRNAEDKVRDLSRKYLSKGRYSSPQAAPASEFARKKPAARIAKRKSSRLRSRAAGR